MNLHQTLTPDMRQLLGHALHRSRLAPITPENHAAAAQLVEHEYAEYWQPLVGGMNIRLTNMGLLAAQQLEQELQA